MCIPSYFTFITPCAPSGRLWFSSKSPEKKLSNLIFSSPCSASSETNFIQGSVDSMEQLRLALNLTLTSTLSIYGKSTSNVLDLLNDIPLTVTLRMENDFANNNFEAFIILFLYANVSRLLSQLTYVSNIAFTLSDLSNLYSPNLVEASGLSRKQQLLKFSVFWGGCKNLPI